LYCTECGEKLEGRFCMNCGTPIQLADRLRVLMANKYFAIGAIGMIALIIGIVILAASGFGSTPESTAKAFYAAMVKGDFHRYVKTIDPEFRSSLGEESGLWEMQTRLMLEAARNEWKQGYYSIQVLYSIRKGDTAEVVVLISSTVDSGGEVTLNLVKRGTKWYIDPNWW